MIDAADTTILRRHCAESHDTPPMPRCYELMITLRRQLRRRCYASHYAMPPPAIDAITLRLPHLRDDATWLRHADEPDYAEMIDAADDADASPIDEIRLMMLHMPSELMPSHAAIRHWLRADAEPPALFLSLSRRYFI